jgi:hypothetical protein
MFEMRADSFWASDAHVWIIVIIAMGRALRLW